LSAKLLAKLLCDVYRLIKMRIDPQRSLERLQRALQIAIAHIDHAKAAERAEMSGFKVDHTGNVTARAGVIAKQKTHRRPLVPSFGEIGVIIDKLAEDLFGAVKHAPVQQRHA
jgi:hypothetical protein